jgi:hypothetical protein
MDYNYRVMTYRHFKNGGWLYLLAFLIALGLRLIQLGAMPLTDAEAEPALQALQIAQGLRPALSPHPFYILSTAILFFLYGGGTDFLARLIPALVGSALVFAPLLVERIKPRPSLILAFFIALDPGLTAISRQVASPILAITFLIFAWGCFSKDKPRLTGFFAALALLSGPSIWMGLLSFGIAWAINQGLQALRPSKSASETELETVITDSATTDYQLPSIDYRTTLRSSLLPFIIIFITAGTLFFIAPNGISAALASLPAFIDRWIVSSNVPQSRLFLSLLVYQPLTILLALLSIIRGWRRLSTRIIPISIWLIVSLLLAIFLPSRQIADLAWTLIPLCALASLEFVRNIYIHPQERNEVIGVAFLTAFIWVFAWLDFSGLVWIPADTREYSIRFWLLIGALFLLVLSLLLVAAGWSIRTARIGGVWGLGIVLGVLSFAGTLGSAGLRGLDNPELWWSPSIPMQADLLESSVREISEFGIGDDFSAPVVIAGVDSPALEWALREHDVRVVDSLDVSTSPYFVVTPFQEDPGLVSAYRGQDFSWTQTPMWDLTASSTDWIRWIALREMPQSGDTIILWARDDLFLDTSTSAPVP